MGVHRPPISQTSPNQTILQNFSQNVSNIGQLDGNISLSTDSDKSLSHSPVPLPLTKLRKRLALVANYLPTVTVTNTRSLFPKIENFKNDLLEREVDVSLISEVWEKAEDLKHRHEITKMLELEGLKYFSTTRVDQGALKRLLEME